MLGGTASSGDRIGVLVYICGKDEERAEGRSIFGKDPSNDCLCVDMDEEDGEGGEAMERFEHRRAGSTPAARILFSGDREFEYEYDFTDEVDESEGEEEGTQEEGARLAALLRQGQPSQEEVEDEEEGMHVHFNLNGCPLNVPWRAVSQIAEIPWAQTALYPTISFAVPSTAESLDRRSPGPATSPASSGASSGSEKSPVGVEQQVEQNSAVVAQTQNTVKIWVSEYLHGAPCQCTQMM
jgi:hypothetical protein